MIIGIILFYPFPIRFLSFCDPILSLSFLGFQLSKNLVRPSVRPSVLPADNTSGSLSILGAISVRIKAPVTVAADVEFVLTPLLFWPP